MPLVKAKSDVKKRLQQQREQELSVSEEAQSRLAAILADAPSLVKFAGTEWEIRPLRMGTTYLIANEARKIKDLEVHTYDNVLIELAAATPSACKCIAFALLNDKNKIYQNGDSNQGFSKLFKRTVDTIMWNTDKVDIATLLMECLQINDVDFFFQLTGTLQKFAETVTAKKRTRTKTAGLR